jgi:hypothetical protein
VELAEVLFGASFVAAACALGYAAFGRLEGSQRAAIVLVNVLAVMAGVAWLVYRPV